MTIGPDRRFTWRAEDVRRLAHRTADIMADYLTQLPERPVFTPVPPEVVERRLAEAIPQDGSEPDAILDEFTATIAPYPFGNGHPRFWGWVNSPPAIMSILADALATTMNPSVAGGNHAAVYVERQVVRWFGQLLGFPETSMGLLVSGGSMATLTGLATARHAKAGFDVRARGLREGPPLTVYMSAEGHGSIRKSIELLGLGGDALRVIPTNDAYQMDVAQLRTALDGDLAAGCRPIAVVANAGAVNTGAIDPIEAIADECRARNVWLHVDAAYGGPAVLSDRYRAALKPLALADSISLDPHKWLYVPVEAGMILVRDGNTMRSAFSLVPPYLRTDDNASGVGGPPWFSEYGFQQSRAFRALKVWAALKYFGVSGYADAIEHDLALAAYLAARIEADDRLMLMAPPSLSIVCFRVVAPALGGDEAALDGLNKELLRRLQVSGRAFLSSTELGGRFVLRACVVNPLGSDADIDALIDAIHKESEQVQ